VLPVTSIPIWTRFVIAAHAESTCQPSKLALYGSMLATGAK
jgi:hypothetical protein